MEEVHIAIAIDPSLNPAAFVARYQQGLWLWLRVLGCDEVLADDLTQEGLIRAIQHAEAGTLEVRSDGEMVGWLRTSARHLFLTHQNKENRRAEILRAEAAETIWARYVGETSGGEDEWLSALGECLNKLKASDSRLASVIDLHYQQGFRAEGVADALSLSVTNVYTMMHRARAILRECVERTLSRDR